MPETAAREPEHPPADLKSTLDNGAIACLSRGSAETNLRRLYRRTKNAAKARLTILNSKLGAKAGATMRHIDGFVAWVISTILGHGGRGI
jgi:hypothetical protein